MIRNNIALRSALNPLSFTMLLEYSVLAFFQFSLTLAHLDQGNCSSPDFVDCRNSNRLELLGSLTLSHFFSSKINTLWMCLRLLTKSESEAKAEEYCKFPQLSHNYNLCSSIGSSLERCFLQTDWNYSSLRIMRKWPATSWTLTSETNIKLWSTPCVRAYELFEC